jgi:hypothetical protein
VESRVETINKSSDGESRPREIDNSAATLLSSSSRPSSHSLPIKAFLGTQNTRPKDISQESTKKKKSLVSYVPLLRRGFLSSANFHNDTHTYKTRDKRFPFFPYLLEEKKNLK